MRVMKWTMSALVVVLLGASCSSSAKTASSEPAAATTTTTAPTDVAVYAATGPYTVGYTTLRMIDRDVDVWYPAADGAAAGKPKATYEQTTPLPTKLKSFVPKKYNTVVTMEAYADLAASTNGPFPVVLFSHGAGAFRMAYSALEAGIASWGFVVVAADYVERGVVTQLPGQTPATLDPERDKRLMLASLDLVTKENDRSASLLHGIVDEVRPRIPTQRSTSEGRDRMGSLGAIGSAGQQADDDHRRVERHRGAADAACNNLRILSGHRSAGLRSASPPQIPSAALCLVSRSGGGMVQYAVDNHLVTQGLAKLLLNGCEKTAVAPEMFWPVAQHFTVAELRTALGIDARPVGLGDAISRAFPGVTVTYQHEP